MRSAHPLAVTAAALFAQSFIAEAGDAVLFRDTFRNGVRAWRVQGEGFKVSAVASDYDGDGMARLDNSNGAKQAFFGIKAGPPDTVLRFSLAAKAISPGNSKVGIHRYGGPIKWVEIGEKWKRVSGELRSHVTSSHWYIVVPAGAVVCVDTVKLRPFALSEAEKAERRRAYRQESERKAVTAYQDLERVRPAPGTMLAVNGRFPMGFYTTRPTGDRPLTLSQIFREHAAGSINLEHNSDFEDWPEHTEFYDKINSNTTATRYIDDAHRHGIGTLMGFDRMMVLKGRLDAIRERATVLTDKPGLFGWYLMDEPTIHGASPDTMLRAYRAVKEVDKDHPVVTTICNTGRLHDFADSTDVIMVDTYPVSISPLFTMAVPIETALAVTNGRKAVWAAVQVHNQDNHRIRRGAEDAHMITTPRRPTVREIRCMTYLAIAHGASGILFYAYDGLRCGRAYDDVQRYAGILDVAGEIDGLSGKLCDDCLLKGTVRGDAGTLVSYIVRGRDAENAVLVAVNGFDRPSGPVDLPLAGGGNVRATLAPHEVLIR